MQPGSLDQQGRCGLCVGVAVHPRQQQGIRLVQRPLVGQKRAERLQRGGRAMISQAPQDRLRLSTTVVLLGQQAGQLHPDGLAVEAGRPILSLQRRPQALEQRRQLFSAGLLATERGQTFEAVQIVGDLLQETAASCLCLVELAHLLQHLGQRPRDRDARRAFIECLLSQNQVLGQLVFLAKGLQTLDQHVKRCPVRLEREGRGECGLDLRRMARFLRRLCEAQVGLAHHRGRACRMTEQLAILMLALLPLPGPPQETGQGKTRLRIARVEIEQHPIGGYRVFLVRQPFSQNRAQTLQQRLGLFWPNLGQSPAQHLGQPSPVARLARHRLQGIESRHARRVHAQGRFQQAHRLLPLRQRLVYQARRLAQAQSPLFGGIRGARIGRPRRQRLHRPADIAPLCVYVHQALPGGLRGGARRLALQTVVQPFDGSLLVP